MGEIKMRLDGRRISGLFGSPRTAHNRGRDALSRRAIGLHVLVVVLISAGPGDYVSLLILQIPVIKGLILHQRYIKLRLFFAAIVAEFGVGR